MQPHLFGHLRSQTDFRITEFLDKWISRQMSHFMLMKGNLFQNMCPDNWIIQISEAPLYTFHSLHKKQHHCRVQSWTPTQLQNYFYPNMYSFQNICGQQYPIILNVTIHILDQTNNNTHIKNMQILVYMKYLFTNVHIF